MMRLGLTGLALTALLFALPATGRAQGDMEWGVKGGLNISGLRGSNTGLRGSTRLFDTKRGIAAGVFGVFDFTPEFGVEVDALFSMKGGKLSGPGVDPSGNPIILTEGFFILDYLEFPILARLNLPVQGDLTPHLYAGPTIALKVSGRVRYSQLPGADLDAARTLDSGLALGASVDLALGARTIVLDARFGLGLTNAFRWSGPDLKNDTFSLMGGLSF